MRALVETAVSFVIFAASLFVPAGRLDWPMAWAVIALWLAFAVVGFVVLSPELIAERSRIVPAGAEPSDVVVAGLGGLFLFPASLVVCGLDARNAWSPALPGVLRDAALAVFAGGYAFTLWGARANPFASTVVRVQRERGHRVIDAGPYAFVRHPLYAGALVAHLALPVALGSLWGIAPAACGAALFVLRTILEERTLAAKLEGYPAYMLRVRWRLVPGVW